jgi:hypothetical protein
METFLEKLQKSKGKYVNVLLLNRAMYIGSYCFNFAFFLVRNYKNVVYPVFGKLVDVDKIRITLKVKRKNKEFAIKHIESFVETTQSSNRWKTTGKRGYYGFCSNVSLRKPVYS